MKLLFCLPGVRGLALALLFVLPVIHSISSVAQGWATKQAIEPSQPQERAIVERDLHISYDCEAKRNCTLDDYLKRSGTCELIASRHGRKLVHRISISNPGCRKRIERARHGIASITKTFTSIVIGHLLEANPALTLQTSLAEALESAGVNYPNRDVTLRDLLTMSTGMVWQEAEQGQIRITDQTGRQGIRSFRTWINKRFATARFHKRKNGHYPFNYSNFDSQLLGVIAESQGDQTRKLSSLFDAAIWSRIASTEELEWKGDFYSSPAAYCCIYMSASDLSRVGDWILDSFRTGSGVTGRWLRQSVADNRLSDRKCRFGNKTVHFRYGYQWWVLPDTADGFTAIGAGGQYLHVFPEQNVVVTRLGNQYDRPDSDLCEAMLVHRMIADTLADKQ